MMDIRRRTPGSLIHHDDHLGAPVEITVTVNGIKTGHTSDAGWCILASATRGGRRIVVVALGAPTEEGRDDGQVHGARDGRHHPHQRQTRERHLQSTVGREGSGVLIWAEGLMGLPPQCHVTGSILPLSDTGRIDPRVTHSRFPRV